MDRILHLFEVFSESELGSWFFPQARTHNKLQGLLPQSVYTPRLAAPRTSSFLTPSIPLQTLNIFHVLFLLLDCPFLSERAATTISQSFVPLHDFFLPPALHQAEKNPHLLSPVLPPSTEPIGFLLPPPPPPCSFSERDKHVKNRAHLPHPYPKTPTFAFFYKKKLSEPSPFVREIRQMR